MDVIGPNVCVVGAQAELLKLHIHLAPPTTHTLCRPVADPSIERGYQYGIRDHPHKPAGCMVPPDREYSSHPHSRGSFLLQMAPMPPQSTVS